MRRGGRQMPPASDAAPLPLSFYFIAGGAGDISACLVSHPFDTLKVRQQLRGELQVAGAARRPALSHTARGMFAQGGLREFYRGLSASVLRQSTFSTLRHGGFAVVCTALASSSPSSAPLSSSPAADAAAAAATSSNALPPHPSKYVSVAAAVATGAVVGSLSALLANPSDVALIRMQSDGHWPAEQRRNYRHAGHAIATIVRTKGLGRLWRGCGPTVLRAALITTTQIPTYHATKRILLKSAPAPWFQRGNDDTKLHLAASASSATVASLVTCPVDVVKTRIINMQRADGNAFYSGALDCVAQTVRAEGVRGLFKGLTPTFIRLGPHTVVLWNVQEAVLRGLRGRGV